MSDKSTSTVRPRAADPDEPAGETPPRPEAKPSPKFLPPLPMRKTEAWPGLTAPEETAVAPIQAQVAALPAPPRLRRRRSWFAPIAFLVVAVIPTLLMAAYMFGVASDQYVAEFRFTVMQASPPSGGGPGGAAGAGGLAALAGLGPGGAGGVSGAMSQNYIVVDYLKSGAAVDDLQQRIGLRALYSRPGVDPLSRFPADGTREMFADYWGRMVKADYDPITGIATARVKAFSAADAFRIAGTMSKMSEDLINRVNERIERQAVASTQAQLDQAQQRFADVRARLDAVRAEIGVIDPSVSLAPINTELARGVRQQLVGLEAQMAAYQQQGLSPDAPAMIALRSQVEALRAQQGRIAGEVRGAGGGGSIAGAVSSYEQINLENTYAQAALVSALQARDQARANAAAQHLFLTPYVAPRLSDQAREPRRAMMVLLTFLISGALWLLLLILVRTVRDHGA